MKKIIFVLAALILVSCLSINAVAVDKQKIGPDLESKLSRMKEGEKIEVLIWLNTPIIDENLIDQMTYNECGLYRSTCKTESDYALYQNTYIRILGEYQSAMNRAFIEELGVPESDIIYDGFDTPLVQLKLTKEQVYLCATFDEVDGIEPQAEHEESVIDGPLPYPHKGDADMDGDLTIFDATCIQRYIADLIKVTEIDLIGSDYDQDGDVTVLDATAIQRHLVGLT